MKKILLGISLVSSVFASDIKIDNTFVSVESGITKIKNSENFVGVKLGTYIYSDNIYKINNRIYVSAGKVLTDSAISFYTTKASLDWIGTTSSLKPFVGVSLGYIYYKTGGVEYSVGTKGAQAGLIYHIGNSIEVETGASWERAMEKKTIWSNSIKKAYASFNYSF